MLYFAEPKHEDIFNWGRDVPLLCVAHVGNVPVGQGTEPLETILGGTWRTYTEYAECTVYIDREGYLAIELYQEGEGLYPGNPENGEHITVYWMECSGPDVARLQARKALEGTDGILTADYFIGLGYQQEII